MARTDRLFKRSFNTCLDHVLAQGDYATVSALARELSVSRTTARRILERLETLGLVSKNTQPIVFLRKPKQLDYFPLVETLTVEESLESAFMSMIEKQELLPGSRISEAGLALKLGVTGPTIREFLIGLSRFGFVRKEQQRHWVLEGFTKQYALELHEIRVMFESRAIAKVCRINDSDPFWGRLIGLQKEHEAIDETTDFDVVDFSALDTRFHRLFYSNADNRLIVGFQDAISLIFNYHYLWSRQGHVQRNLLATAEHLTLIEAILSKNETQAVRAMQTHLATTHQTFLASIEPMADL